MTKTTSFRGIALLFVLFFGLVSTAIAPSKALATDQGNPTVISKSSEQSLGELGDPVSLETDGYSTPARIGMTAGAFVVGSVGFGIPAGIVAAGTTWYVTG